MASPCGCSTFGSVKMSESLPLFLKGRARVLIFGYYMGGCDSQRGFFGSHVDKKFRGWHNAQRDRKEVGEKTC